MALRMVGKVARLAERVARSDRDLARQMKRASTSVPLNIAEGEYSQGGNQKARFHTAMGSARETIACLEVSVAARYIGADDTKGLVEEIDSIVGALWKLVHRG
jgi:four helix bundle protein